ncbi:TonB-dependent receptor [Psychroserpens sp. SPM9]|uniref:SusC/RagA family TonB-linked outer membrane protein n=1 Tax=Psychroserpens sp. SPM9 TaxID=2975598 RepID=UPI0021A2EB5F|nr:TonB-dependent receptor [Psychroserpens sp. SPM9]MDG5491338.1 TonB-dependent receptor [Psychroserpens sp. SPM9]
MTAKFLSFLLLLMTTFSFSQEVTVKGTVTDQATGQPIPGVNVLVKGTAKGASTDFDGVFTITNVPVNSTLVFTYIGYKTKEFVVIENTTISIALEEDAESLDEVVVIGYGTQRKKEITGAVAVVSSETIENLKPTRIEQALQGQVAGVNITSESGSPGSASTISIRGVSTNGDNRPLILVDGNVIEDLSVINPNDIETLNVLKDATAGIYGVRAANGVILITTKTGRKNVPLSVEINTFGGIQQTSRKIPSLNATEYALLVNEAFAANGEPLVFDNVFALGQGTDWQDEVFQNAAQYNISATIKGGKEKSSYAYGASFLSQDGIVGGSKSNFSRYTQRGNYTLDFLDNFQLKSGLIFTHTNRKTLAETGLGSVLFNALNMAPTFSVRDENGAYTIAEGLGNEVINPLAQIDNTFNRTFVDKIAGNVSLSYNFLDHFTAQANYQFNYAEVESFAFNPVAFFGNGKVFNRDRSEVVVNNNIFRDYTFDAFIKYENKFNDVHNLSLLVATSVFKTTGSFSGFVGFDVPGNAVENATLEQASDLQNIYPNGNAEFDARLLSYFSRLQYDYKGKYLLSAVVRRDGSTKFGPENKFGIFPSGSVGWIISEEDFLSDNNTINFLKLRGSYGILGNDRIPDFRFVSLLNGEGTYVIDDEIQFGTAIGAVSNPEIRWEKQKTVDIGIDAKLFNNQLDITMDYYKKRTEDLLIVPQVSGLLGVTAPGSSAPVVNAGIVENKGFEFSVGYNNVVNDNFNYSIRYNIATLDNNVVEVSADGDFLSGGSFGVGQDPPARMEEGFPIGYFRGYKTDGIFQNQAEIDAYPTLNSTVQPGDLRFVDVNGDGVIDDNDKTDLGNPLPKATMGLNLSFEYKNFDFAAYAFASVGNKIVRNYERNQALTNRSVYYLDRWTGEGSTNSFPRVTSGANVNSLFSDFFVEDGDFIRLQNIQLGYSLSDKVLENSKISKLRFYVSAANLVTLTEYRGYDPTASTGEAIGGGIDYGFYPNPKTFLLGMNLKF